MRFLFVSTDLIAGNLANLLVQEGHEVRLFVEERDRRKNFSGMVEQTEDWKKELPWVGKDGVIVFDDSGYGKEQDMLRDAGFSVFGGSSGGDDLEFEREFAQNIFKQHGLDVVPSKDFPTIKQATDFIKRNPDYWVIKQNNHAPKSMNYVGQDAKGFDVISVLESYASNDLLKKEKITLQKRVFGVEIGIGRYFNGTNWVGPIEYNVEHKKFLAGDLGPTTSEMGTIAWYDDDEENILYKKVIAPFKEYLQKINFRGDFEINCIVNEKEIAPLEATPRFGSPIVHLHSEIHDSPWGELLSAVARGEDYDLKWKRGFGIVILMALPPFPYQKKSAEHDYRGIYIDITQVKKEEISHLHFEEISKDEKGYYISDNRGYVLYVTNVGEDLEKSFEDAYDLTKRVVIPKVMYRNDIGERFIEKDLPSLKKWGYIK